MIAEQKDKLPEDLDSKFSIPSGTSLSVFSNTITLVTPFFLKVLKGHPYRRELNEDGLTQILVQEISKYLRSYNYPFNVQTQYVDTIGRTRGRPDFFFYQNNELGEHSLPTYVVEAKRLPSQTFVKEYVIGEKQNGGIERFKVTKHGKGINPCGLVAFIEKEGYAFWTRKVNEWITEQASLSPEWQTDEILSPDQKTSTGYFRHTSLVHVKSAEDKQLEHVWIDIQ
jgi:hypothetical protein